MTKEQLKSYLVEEAEYEQYVIDSMTAAELVDAYLAWNGIRHFTDDILKIVKAAYELK